MNADKKKVISERNNQGVTLGGGKGSKTVNCLDNLKDLKKQNSKFSRNIKALNKKVKTKMMKEMIMMNLKMMVANLGWGQSKKKYKKN